MIDEVTIYNILSALKSDGYECFSSEAQLRDAFAIKLGMQSQDYIILPEYTISKPSGWRCSEDLLFFDLLIQDNKAKEKILIEFKYKTQEGIFYLRNGAYIELHAQSDITNGRYAVWRDIYRIETFADMNAVDKGFVVFITNNKTYFAEPKVGILSEHFSISEGVHCSENKYWNTNNVATCTSIHSTYRKDQQPLIIANDYTFGYDTYSDIQDNKGRNHRFYQLVIPIYSKMYAEKIETDLKKMGKEIFVKYYDDFKSKDPDICKKKLAAEGYTRNSINTRVSTGIKLFEDKRNIEALRHIIDSQKVNSNMRDAARAILNKELERS